MELKSRNKSCFQNCRRHCQYSVTLSYVGWGCINKRLKCGGEPYSDTLLEYAFTKMWSETMKPKSWETNHTGTLLAPFASHIYGISVLIIISRLNTFDCLACLEGLIKL